MLTFCEAVKHAVEGKTIVSSEGYKYKLEDIAPVKFGSNWVIFSQNSNMTKFERQNFWHIEGAAL